MLILKNVNFYIITFNSLFLIYHFYIVMKLGDSFLAIKEEYLGKNQQFLNNSKIKIIIQDEVEEAMKYQWS